MARGGRRGEARGQCRRAASAAARGALGARVRERDSSGAAFHRARRGRRRPGAASGGALAGPAWIRLREAIAKARTRGRRPWRVRGDRLTSRLTEHPFPNPTAGSRSTSSNRCLATLRLGTRVFENRTEQVSVPNLWHRAHRRLAAGGLRPRFGVAPNRACCGMAEVFGPCRIVCRLQFCSTQIGTILCCVCTRRPWTCVHRSSTGTAPTLCLTRRDTNRRHFHP